MNTSIHDHACAERLQELFGSASVAVAIVASDQAYRWFNNAFVALFGYTQEQLTDLDQWWLLAYPDPRYRQKVQKQWLSAQATDFALSRPIRARVRCANGTTLSIHFLARMIDERVVVLCEQLYARETTVQLAQNVFDNASEGILITDERTRILSVNRSFERITLYSSDEAIGQTPSMLRSNRHDSIFYAQMWTELRLHGHWQGEIWNRRKDGRFYIQRQNIDAIKNSRGKVTHYVSIFEDITELKRQEEQIIHMAYHDALTGLPNREMLIERIERNIERTKRDKGRFALLFLDLDRFKQINDSLGHDVGDTLLIIIAARLRGECRIVDTVCRFGGDEFIILLDRVESDEALLRILQRLLERIEAPIPLKNHLLHVTSSIGTVLYPGDGESPHELIQHADIAMYNAKKGGKNRYSFFDAATNAALRKQLKMEMQLHRGIERQEFELFFQPKISLDTAHLCGAEVLLRWHHKKNTSPLRSLSVLPKRTA
ncbi:MAG: diguanylate cyclase [Campylobacterales bacterium]|nr:diguanylate cyclase [Campylobacterales bacterium]